MSPDATHNDGLGRREQRDVFARVTANLGAAMAHRMGRVVAAALVLSVLASMMASAAFLPGQRGLPFFKPVSEGVEPAEPSDSATDPERAPPIDPEIIDAIEELEVEPLLMNGMSWDAPVLDDGGNRWTNGRLAELGTAAEDGAFPTRRGGTTDPVPVGALAGSLPGVALPIVGGGVQSGRLANNQTEMAQSGLNAQADVGETEAIATPIPGAVLLFPAGVAALTLVRQQRRREPR
ncbi:MAG: hypothetical protein AAF830_14030 [Pseudomonadota bacterium]